MKKMSKMKQNSGRSDQVILYGRHAVWAALANPQRQIEKLVCSEENVAEVKKQFPKLTVLTATKKEIDKLLPADVPHQGYALYTRPLESPALEDMCVAAQDMPQCRVVVLDQVTDPQNIGAIIRSAAAFGALAVVMQDKNAPWESGALVKAAAGTFEIVPLVRVTNLSRALDKLKDSGFWVVGMDGYATQTIESLDKSGRLAVVMGSEGTGMRRLVEENCDVSVRLPISDKVESLNVSTAAAIVLYELSRKQ